MLPDDVLDLSRCLSSRARAAALPLEPRESPGHEKLLHILNGKQPIAIRANWLATNAISQ